MLSFSLPDMKDIAALIETVAAEEITPRFGKLSAGEIRTKTGPEDLVTVADEAVEARLTPALRDMLPGSVVVGEEAVAADESILDLLDGTAPVWVIDPVDGTSNFANARPHVAVILALVAEGETVAAWIHDPIRGGMATAGKGQGAWLNSNPLSAAGPAPLEEMPGSLNLSFFCQNKREKIERLQHRLGPVSSLHCAGQEYLSLCKGEKSFALYRRIKPWDHAAGVLMHQEAGGYSAKLDGSPYRPADREGGLMLAPDQESWNNLHDLFFQDNAA